MLDLCLFTGAPLRLPPSLASQVTYGAAHSRVTWLADPRAPGASPRKRFLGVATLETRTRRQLASFPVGVAPYSGPLPSLPLPLSLSLSLSLSVYLSNSPLPPHQAYDFTAVGACVPFAAPQSLAVTFKNDKWQAEREREGESCYRFSINLNRSRRRRR
jgi:hypothetical protein